MRHKLAGASLLGAILLCSNALFSSQPPNVTIAQSAWDPTTETGVAIVSIDERQLRCEIRKRSGGSSSDYELTLTTSAPEFHSSETSHGLKSALMEFRRLNCAILNLRMLYLPHVFDSDIRTKLASILVKRGQKNAQIVTRLQESGGFENYAAIFEEFGLSLKVDSGERFHLVERSNNVESEKEKNGRKADGSLWLSLAPK